MQHCIFSIITPVFSVTWSSEIIIIYWFAAQETFLIIINAEKCCVNFFRIEKNSMYLKYTYTYKKSFVLIVLILTVSSITENEWSCAWWWNVTSMNIFCSGVALVPCRTGGACWRWWWWRAWPLERCAPPGTRRGGRWGRSSLCRWGLIRSSAGAWAADWCNAASWAWGWASQTPERPHTSPSVLQFRGNQNQYNTDNMFYINN